MPLLLRFLGSASGVQLAAIVLPCGAAGASSHASRATNTAAAVPVSGSTARDSRRRYAAAMASWHWG